MAKEQNKPQRSKGKLPEVKQDNVADIQEKILPPCDYNMGEIEDFLDMVFHGETDDSEGHVMLWRTEGKSPGYPMTEERFMKAMDGTKKGYAVYYGTSTCRADLAGNPRNMKKLFDKLHVVVLDDIGTKVPVEKIPEALKPTYIIESSAGNYQYGYVLKEPVTVLEHAEALIQLVYESGLSDEGGKMPTKLVRMPCGCNGKDGPTGQFKVRLVSTDGPLWSPDDLFDVMDLGVNWSDVVTNVDEVLKSRPTKYNGVSPWSPIKARHAALGGIIDPVMEWLSDESYIKQETDEWITIRCPWADEHSEGTEDTAGYVPLGQGDDPCRRVFSCFHSHGKINKTADFLQFVADAGGPEVPIVDNAAHLVAAYAFDQTNNSVWRVKDVEQPREIAMDAFRNTYPHKVRVTQYGGKSRTVAEHALWLHSQARVIVQGRVFDPSTNAKIVEDNIGDLRVNMFHRPEWGDGDYDKDDVKMFNDFLQYLIPGKFERNYFIEWLAAKAQNMAFRGAGIVMIAKQQGTGRGTLADMIRDLFGSVNVETVPFTSVTGEAQYNDWLEKPFIITNETKDLGHNTKAYFASYERLKDRVDPMPQEDVRINPKFGKQRHSTIYSSYLMFSNHDNALAVADNDRRFFVLRNAVSPATPEYFLDLQTWRTRQDPLTRRPVWAKSVWRWLMEQPVNLAKMHAPAPSTAAKDDMIQGSKSAFTVAAEAAIDAHPGKFIGYYQIKSALQHVVGRLNLVEFPDRQLHAVVGSRTQSLGADSQMKIDNRKVRPKVKISALSDPELAGKFTGSGNLTDRMKRQIRAEVLTFDMEHAIESINTALDLIE